MFEQLPDELRQTFWGASIATLMAWLGRLLWHVTQVKAQKRRFFSIHLVWELITALAMGFVADGMAEYFNLDGKPALAAIVVISYLGPRGLQSLLIRFAENYVPSRGGNNEDTNK